MSRARYEPAVPCVDCVAHGEYTAAEWLDLWPLGAEWHAEFGAHLCDACVDDRLDQGSDSHPWEDDDT